jgi:hypothetical protein
VYPFGYVWTPALVHRVASLPYFGLSGRLLALLDATTPSPGAIDAAAAGTAAGSAAAAPLLVTLAEKDSPYVCALSSH